MRLAILAALAVTATAGAAHAAPSQADKDSASELAQAPLEQPASPTQGIQLTSEDGQSSIALRYGWEESGGFGSQAAFGVVNAFSIGVSAPVGDEKGEITPASLDALASSATVELRFTSTGFSRPAVSDEAGMADICNAIISAKSRLAGQPCTLTFVTTNADDTPAEGRVQEFSDLITGKRPSSRVWGFSGRFGTDTFDYVDAGTFTERSVDKSGWSVRGFYAMGALDKSWLVTADYQHQDAYEAQKTDTLCPGGGGACVSGPVGSPKHVIKDIVSLEARRDFGDFSASATIHYDTASDVLAFEAPIYLPQGKVGAFNGGVKLGWRSDTGDSSLVVFIGRALP